MFLNRLLGRPKSSPSASGSLAGWWSPFVDAGFVRLAGDTEPASAEAALAYHAWYRAISLIAQKVASVPKHLLRRTGSGPNEGKERAREHPVYRLVHERANSEQTAFQFWLQMAGHVPSRGNAYAAIWRENGVPTELLPMDPDRTYPVRKNGRLWYVTFPFGADPGAEGIRLKPEEVLHFKGFGCDGLVGYPVWAKAAEEIGLARGQRQLEASRNKNSGRPAMILTTDAKLPDPVKDRLRNDWERMHVGLDNAGKTAILDNGLKATPVSMTAEDLEQTGAAQMSLVAISNYTGVPPSKLGASGKNYSSQEQEDQAFVNDGLDFYFNVFEDEAGSKLLTDAERAGGYEVKANREALLRPATRDKFEVLRIATAGKPIMTQNEARKLIDLAPKSDEPEADKLLTPLNMGQGGIDNQPDDPADDPPGRQQGEDRAAAGEAVDAARRVIEHVTLKLVRRVSFHAKRLADKPDAFLAWLDAFGGEHLEVFRAELAPCEALAAAVAPGGNRVETAEYLLGYIRQGFDGVAESTPAGRLGSAVERESVDQEKVLPPAVSRKLLGR